MYTPSVNPADLPGGLANSNFGGAGGNIATEKVVTTLFDYDPFSFYQAVAQRHSSYPAFRQMLRMQNATRRVSAPTTGHYEQDWKNNLFAITPTTGVITPSGGAGNPIVLEVDANYTYDSSTTIDGDPATGTFVRVGDVIQALDGVRARVTSKDVSVSPPQVTLTPLNAADDLDASFIEGGVYAIFDNMWGEGSTIPEGVTPRVLKYTNDFQIVKEGVHSTGSSLTNKTFVQFVAGQDGSIFLAMKQDAMWRYERAMCYALLFGTTADNLTSFESEVGYDVDIKGTEGFIPFVTLNGHSDTYTVGSYGIDDFDALSVIFEQERVGARNIITYDGFSVFQETENALQSLLNANLSVELMKQLGQAGVPMDVLQPYENTDFSFYIGFRSLKKSGYTFHFRMLHEFNEYIGAGYTGYNYPSYRIAAPLGFATDNATGSNVPYVAYEFKGLNGYDRHDLVGTVGGIGVGGPDGFVPVASNTFDIARMGMLSEIAAHFACANKCVLQLPA